jgi:predicted amidophosphoribosyltransferase
MTICQHCSQDNPTDHCSRCGRTNVSVVEDSLDAMIQAASTPSLATLIRRAKASGSLDTAGPEYEAAKP